MNYFPSVFPEYQSTPVTLSYESYILGDGSKGALQRLHAASNPHSGSRATPCIVEDQHRWTVYNSCVNIPAALNDPRLIKRETDFFTKTWGVDFYEKTDIPPSNYLPDINKYHFETYIRRTSAVRKSRNFNCLRHEKKP